MSGPSTPSWARRAILAATAVAAATLVGCGTSRTTLPADIGNAAPGGVPLTSTTGTPGPASTGPAATLPSVDGSVPTTSPFQTAGLKQTLPDGATVVVSYPIVGARPGKDQAPPPDGSSYALVTVKLCAAKTAPLATDLVDPARFSVEVPGQGVVAWSAATPQVRGVPLAKGQPVSAGACAEGVLAFVIAGERHIESVSYDADTGIYRWVT